jgi:hypothetical protein
VIRQWTCNERILSSNGTVNIALVAGHGEDVGFRSDENIVQYDESVCVFESRMWAS